MDIENGGFGELSSPPLNSTQLFAGSNDGLSQTFNGVSTFVGLQAHSQKPGYRVIFPTLDMSRYVEIAEQDILASEELSPTHSPFGALGGTRLSVRQAAPITTNRAVSRTQEVDDEFDLDIRLGASGWSLPTDIREGPGDEGLYAAEKEGEKHGPTHKGHHTCHGGETCNTCHTICEGITCPVSECKVTGGQQSCCKEPPGTCM